MKSKKPKAVTKLAGTGTLVIVESPTKAKTISKFLGKDYIVQASMGHVRDLPKSRISIDVEHNFTPTYTIPLKAKPVVADLKEKAANAGRVILATDEDREGEAIAWHLVEALDLGAQEGVDRIVFHEITEGAIMEALANPRRIDMKLVNAQQARRVLDRLVGYELSPFLWRKVRYGLSAGRVQSVAVRLVVEREREIEKFNKEEYWSIEGTFAKKGDAKTFAARLIAANGKSLGKMDIKNETEAQALLSALKGASYRVLSVTKKDVVRNPAPPFITSTLQQEAARKLGFSAKQTMVIAQQLYERGAITYMRTDSVNLAASALAQAQNVISEQFGAKYALPEPRRYTGKAKGAQEAHEAIRPTNLAKTPADADFADSGQTRLYDLIWKRTMACQMQPAQMEQTAVDIEALSAKRPAPSYSFRANGQVVKFDGFIRVYTEGTDEGGEEELEGMLPDLAENDAVNANEILPLQHFTEPPPRFSDATLIKALEAAGIGRPSTYAPTLSTIQDRDYVTKVDKKYAPTETGVLVNDILVEHFPEIVDIGFTSHVEEELDDIAEGKITWTEVCSEFYGPFKKHLIEKEASVEKKIEISETPCPHCGKPMLIKFGRMGKFLACPDPENKFTLPMPEEAAMIKALEEKTKGELCPLCEKPMGVKRGRFGYFLGCVDYPKCKGISKIWNKTGFKCPNCAARLTNDQQLTTNDAAKSGTDKRIGDIVEKKSRGRGKPFFACTRYPDCTFVMNKKPETQEELDAALVYWKANPPKPKKKWGEKKAVDEKAA